MATLIRNLQTKAGLDLIRGAVGGVNKLVYTTAELYAKNISALSDDQVRALSSVDTPLLSCDLKVNNINSNNVNLTAQFTNESLQNDITFRTIGWFATTTVAKAQGKPPVLFAVSQIDNEAHLIAGASNKSTSFFFAELMMGISTDTQVELVASETGFVTIAEMAQALLDLSKKGLIDLGNRLPDQFDLANLHNTSLQYVPAGTVKGLPNKTVEALPGSGLLGGYLVSIGNNTTAQDSVLVYFEVGSGSMYISYYMNKLNAWTKWVEIGKNTYSKDEMSKLLADYATKNELTQKANIADVYSKSEADANLSKKLDDLIQKLDSKLANKANVSDVYNKSEADANLAKEIDKLTQSVDGKLANKANTSDVYNKNDIDGKIKDINKNIDGKLDEIKADKKVKTVQSQAPDDNGNIDLTGKFTTPKDLEDNSKTVLDNIKNLSMLQNTQDNVTSGGKIDLDNKDFQKDGFFGFTNSQVVVGNHVFNWTASNLTPVFTLGNKLSGWYVNINIGANRLFQAVAIDNTDRSSLQLYTRTLDLKAIANESNFELRLGASDMPAVVQMAMQEVVRLSFMSEPNSLDNIKRKFTYTSVCLDNRSDVRYKATAVGLFRIIGSTLYTNAPQSSDCYIATRQLGVMTGRVSGYVLNLPAGFGADSSGNNADPNYCLQIVIAHNDFAATAGINPDSNSSNEKGLRVYYRISKLVSEKPDSSTPDDYINATRPFTEPASHEITQEVQSKTNASSAYFRLNERVGNCDMMDGTLHLFTNPLATGEYSSGLPLIFNNYKGYNSSYADYLPFSFKSRNQIVDRGQGRVAYTVFQEFKSAGFIFKRSDSLMGTLLQTMSLITAPWQLAGIYNPFETQGTSYGLELSSITNDALGLAMRLPEGTDLNNIGYGYVDKITSDMNITSYFGKPVQSALYPQGTYLLPIGLKYLNAPYPTADISYTGYYILQVYRWWGTVFQKVIIPFPAQKLSYSRVKKNNTWSNWL
ncbi:MAG: hypothetical protein [Bacteriophage sp.]|nr:MAG: hypothetical protein [Bacteriophage sp.]